MSTKVGKHGFHIRDMGKVQELYDNMIIEEIFDKNCCEDYFNYKKYVENKIVLDLGSHIGITVKKFLDLNAKKVICVEPNKKLLECLKKNLKSIPAEKIEILEGAVDTCSGITTFYEFQKNSGGSTIEKEKVNKMFNTKNNNILSEKYVEHIVNTFSFYDLIKKYQPSVIKMDIECIEWKLLQNSPPSCVNMIIIEWHNSLFPEYDVSKLPKWIDSWNILFDNQKTKVYKNQNNKLIYYNSGRDMVITNVL